MFTKDKWLKIFIILLVVGVAATLIIFLIPKNKTIRVSAKDTQTVVDETFEIEYEVSDPFATVKFVVKDESIIEKVAGFVNKFKAKSSGQTEVEVVASNAQTSKSCTCKVEVLPKEEPSTPKDPSDPNNNKPNENPDDNTDDNNPNNNEDEQTPTNPDENQSGSHPEQTPQEFVNKFTIVGVDGNILNVGDELLIITLKFDKSVDLLQGIKFETDKGITIQKVQNASATYKLSAQNSGTILVYNASTFLGKIIIEKQTI